ncbi:MAG: septum formation inhibitor Maf [Sphingobacteriales bacterium]|nr:septum formation inhibitor Maf [Sphingobacteriales bacterium]
MSLISTPLIIPQIILASKSPRRQELLKLMGIDFKVVLKDVDESYPEGLKPHEVALYIAKKKAHAFDEVLTNEIVVTADTIVVVDDLILGKPENEAHAFEILSQLSGRKHEVITAVSLISHKGLHSFFDTTEVYFKLLSEEQIRYYISTSQPMDKAGAYGIQDWIGLIGIEKIVGSYTNVVGLPTEKLYEQLSKL